MIAKINFQISVDSGKRKVIVKHKDQCCMCTVKNHVKYARKCHYINASTKHSVHCRSGENTWKFTRWKYQKNLLKIENKIESGSMMSKQEWCIWKKQ